MSTSSEDVERQPRMQSRPQPQPLSQQQLVVAGPPLPRQLRGKRAKRDGQRKALSTERSRQCRERQKLYSQNLELAVRALRRDIADLEILRNLREERSLRLHGVAAGSLEHIVREYMRMFRHGMPSETLEMLAIGKKRALGVAQTPSNETQREFLNCIMDPCVQVFDWCGRFAYGTTPLLNGWTAWADWHAALDFELEHVEVLDAEDTLAVSTRASLRVRVSQRTIDHLFPHIAGDAQLCAKLLGQEICYPMRDIFYFSPDRRIVKYQCEVDFVAALLPLVGDYRTASYLITPPDQAPLDDLAIRTSPADLTTRSRLDVDFLLSD